MSLLVEKSPLVFLFLTVIIGGGAAALAGRALAATWRPVWQTVAYMFLLGLVVRFFHFSLFDGTLLSLHYYLADTLILCASALIAYRLTRVRQMINQYPWLYERAGPFSWRSRAAD